jgi:hypothetical protein
VARKKRSMSAEHKAALAEGRRQSRAVKAYLEALHTSRPKRGRKRTPESIKKQLAQVEDDLVGADPMQELLLVQKRRDLERALAALDEKVDLSGLEKDFVDNAQDYAKSKGISYASFREVGVPAEVLRKAGISRSS